MTKKEVINALLLSWFIPLLFCRTLSHAQEDYRFEFLPLYNTANNATNERGIAYSLSMRYYFKPVTIGSGPYAEAAFLERIGAVELAFGRSKAENRAGLNVRGGPFYGGSLVYQKPGASLYLSASYLRSAADFFAPFDGGQRSDTYVVQFGRYFGENIRVTLGYLYGMTNLTIPVTGVDRKSTVQGYALTGKWVKELKKTTALALEGIVERSHFDNGTGDGARIELLIGGDYYFTPALNVGLGLRLIQSDNDRDEGTVYSAETRLFLTPKFSFGATYTKFNGDTDEDRVSLLLVVRI